METQTAFHAKLSFVFKALSLTRARVASELAVDKSLVGRWATGASKPSTHNLSRLSALIAIRIGHFTNLDWDRELDSLAQKLGVDQFVDEPVPQSFNMHDFFSPLFGDILAMTEHRAAAYEGFYVSTRAYYQYPGKFIRDRVMIRRAPNGLLRLTQVTGGVKVDGWIMAHQSQLFVVGVEKTSRSLVFCIGNGVNAVKAEAYEGIALYCALDSGRTPIATPFVTERVADLKGEEAADDAWFAEFGALPPIVDGRDLPPSLQAHLARDFGSSELLRGGDWLLAMPIARSLSRAFHPD